MYVSLNEKILSLRRVSYAHNSNGNNLVMGLFVNPVFVTESLISRFHPFLCAGFQLFPVSRKVSLTRPEPVQHRPLPYGLTVHSALLGFPTPLHGFLLT
jgi:hypothetical protein